MNTFGNRLLECRKAKDFSQDDLGKLMNTYGAVIGRYERDEVVPSINVVIELAKHLGTTVGYLAGEGKERDINVELKIIDHLNLIRNLPPKDQKDVLSKMETLFKGIKLKGL